MSFYSEGQRQEGLSLGKSELLVVEVQGGEIIVTAPNFYASYVKPITTRPRLILRRRSDTDASVPIPNACPF